MRKIHAPMIVLFGLLGSGVANADIDFQLMEDFLRQPDGAAFLQRLTPGSEEADFFRVLLEIRNKRPAGALKVLSELEAERSSAWWHPAMKMRATLLTYDSDPRAALDGVRDMLRLRFDHQRETPGARMDLPSRLDPATVAFETLAGKVERGETSVSQVEDRGVRKLVGRALSVSDRRAFLGRLRRPDVPGLARLVAADLDDRTGGGFGYLPVHGVLTVDQLEECARLRPSLMQDSRWVLEMLRRLKPPDFADPRADRASRRRWLDGLGAFASKLSPSFNSLRAYALYHRLDLDRMEGKYDQALFVEYLKLPRVSGITNADFMARQADRGQWCDLSAGWGDAVCLPPVGDDQPLVRDYLSSLFDRSDSMEPFAPYLRDEYVKEVFAESRLLSGRGDPAALVDLYPRGTGPERVKALRERVDIDFLPSSPTSFAPAEPVRLSLAVKNVRSLVVKVYPINTLNFHRLHQKDPGMDVELDGLVPAQEKAHSFDEPPMRRVVRQFDFPEMAGRGVWVVEFIGGGRSSRALVCKGRLTCVQRCSAAGYAVAVRDEAGRPVPGASVLLGSREYSAEPDGEVLLPFPGQPGPRLLILRAGDFTSLETVHQNAETFQFSAGLHLEREQLLAGRTAKLLVRPLLTVGGSPAPLSILEDVRLSITCTDRRGASSVKETAPFALQEDGESAAAFPVPEALSKIDVALTAKVKAVSTGQSVPVSHSASFQVGTMEAGAQTEAFHLERRGDGWVLHLLGKNGEPVAHRAVNLSLVHEDFRDPVLEALATDGEGRLFLGAMPGVVRVSAVMQPESAEQSWELVSDWSRRPAIIQASARSEVAVPDFASAASSSPGDRFSLFEKRGGVYVKDWTSHVAVSEGYARLKDLPQGDYEWNLLDEDRSIAVRVADGEEAGGWVVGTARALEASPTKTLQIIDIKEVANTIKIRIANARKDCRVHVACVRFAPPFQWASLDHRAWPSPSGIPSLAGPASIFRTGREVGDEYRYIMERRNAPKLPGSMLARPGILLNPWAVAGTQTGVKPAAAGEGWGAGAGSGMSGSAAAGVSKPSAEAGGAAFASIDFLATPATVWENLRPDAGGEVSVPLEAGQSRSWCTVLAMDGESSVYREALFPEKPVDKQDIRLAKSMDPEGHFVSLQTVTCLRPGEELRLETGSARYAVYGDIASVYRLFRALLPGDARLAEFEFVTRWQGLSQEEKRALYSKYASHELHLFLFAKDPEFFRAAVVPHLANKREKTFVDDYLLGADLATYARPSAYQRLNLLERVLLSKRLADTRECLAKNIRDACGSVPPDERELDRIFETALRNGEGGAAGGGDAGPEDQGGLSPVSTGRLEDGFASAENAKEEAAAPAKSAAPKPMMAMPASPVMAPAPSQGYAKDAERRSRAPVPYQKMDKTQEWAETDYYRIPPQGADARLVPFDRFWLDAAEAAGPALLSRHLAEAPSNFTSAMAALALLDLPFEAGKLDIRAEKGILSIRAATPAAVFHSEIRKAEAEKAPAALVVSRNVFRRDDPVVRTPEGEEPKYVSGPFQSRTVYVGRAIMTNPGVAPRTVDVLVQIPQGAVPVLNGKATFSFRAELEGFQTRAEEYAFYFPEPGDYTEFPVHLSRNGRLLAFAEPMAFSVTDAPPPADERSWKWVSQNGSLEDVLRYLGEGDLSGADLADIAWRMQDRVCYARVMEAVEKRGVFDGTLYSYSIKHGDAPRVGEYLLGQPEFLRLCGAIPLKCALVDADPFRLGFYRHLEYSPLVNARAHVLGKERTILNDRLRAQYPSFLRTLLFRDVLRDADFLEWTYYLLLQDRVQEAGAVFAKVKPQALSEKLPYDYFAAWFDLLEDRPTKAGTIAEKYKDYTVERWRELFRDVRTCIDEAVGGAGRQASDASSSDERGRRMEAAASAEPSLEMKVEGRKIFLTSRHLTKCTLSFYPTDVEVLFSLNPFAQGASQNADCVRPAAAFAVNLPPGGGTQTVELPPRFHNSNGVVEVSSGGVVRSALFYDHSMTVQVLESVGQIRVLSQSGALPISKAYVKAYARMKDGQVQFYKDGYTDIRGRFDFAALSTDELDRVDRFSILVLTEAEGAAVREAAPPTR